MSTNHLSAYKLPGFCDVCSIYGRNGVIYFFLMFFRLVAHIFIVLHCSLHERESAVKHFAVEVTEFAN